MEIPEDADEIKYVNPQLETTLKPCITLIRHLPKIKGETPVALGQRRSALIEWLRRKVAEIGDARVASYHIGRAGVSVTYYEKAVLAHD